MSIEIFSCLVSKLYISADKRCWVEITLITLIYIDLKRKNEFSALWIGEHVQSTLRSKLSDKIGMSVDIAFFLGSTVGGSNE